MQMRFVIQCVDNAEVEISGKIVGKIGKGYLVLAGISDTDTRETADRMIEKMLKLRIFEDENGKTNLNLAAVGGEILPRLGGRDIAELAHGDIQ